MRSRGWLADRKSRVRSDDVALAAIQGMYQVVKEKDAEISGFRSEVSALQSQNAELDARLPALEQA